MNLGRKSLHLQALGTGRLVRVPIWCLRWVQGGVHSQMTFTAGNHKDTLHSCPVFFLVHVGVDVRAQETLWVYKILEHGQ